MLRGKKKMNAMRSHEAQGPEGEENRCFNSELWHACAGPLVCLPTAGTRVVYFPQGHCEQVAATTNKQVEGHIPNYPSLSPHLFCQLHSVTMHVDPETDEVYAQMTLQPLSQQEQKQTLLPIEMGIVSKQPTNYFCKNLTASDTSTHGGFSVPRRAAEKVFPPLDFSQQPPLQELIARDLHGVEWKFKHIYRGQPKRHLLTTGWSVFVSTKRLVAGDSVLFIWNENNQLLLGIRRANRPQAMIPSSVLSSDSMHIGLLAAAAHAAATNSRFTVFYNPRACPSEFVIPLSKYVKAVFHTHVSVGMRFRMLFETEECSVRRYMGTITGTNDLDPVGWPNSQWRSIKVGWDESTACERRMRVSLWEIEPLTTFPMHPSLFPFRFHHPWHLGASFSHGEQGLHSFGLPSHVRGPWMQQRFESSLAVNELNRYQTMPAGAFEGIQGGEITKQLLLENQHSSPFPNQSWISSTSLHHQGFQPALQQQGISSESLGILDNQHDYVQQQQLQAQYEQQSQSQGYPDTLQTSDNHMQQKSNLHSQFSEKAIFPDSSFIFSSFASSTSSSIYGNTISACLEGNPKHLNCSQLAKSIVCHQSDAPLEPDLNRTHMAPFGNGVLFPSFLEKDSSVGNQNSPVTQNHGPNLTIDSTVNDASATPLADSCLRYSLLDEAQVIKASGELGPHSQTFVKVYKSGSVGRSLDITRFSNYDQLRLELGHMFGVEGLLEDPHRSGWQLVFVDRENDVLLLGDDPWESFVNNVWYIKILSPEDVHNELAGS